MWVIRIDQRSFAAWFFHSGVNLLASVCPGVLAVEGDSKRPCWATTAEDRQKQEWAVPVLLLPASVVLAAVLNRICFKAFQLFRCVQWRLFPFAYQSLKQSLQSFHFPILVNHTQFCSGHNGEGWAYRCPPREFNAIDDGWWIHAGWETSNPLWAFLMISRFKSSWFQWRSRSLLPVLINNKQHWKSSAWKSSAKAASLRFLMKSSNKWVPQAMRLFFLQMNSRIISRVMRRREVLINLDKFFLIICLKTSSWLM